ncbi:hypothetical protein [Amorphus orientalis]|uniref:Uncharacterized protein n=1 Tax=Amorphus orientalis TaxID=649198 RepID=A0AAE4ATP5_9HYPH|nr:hypothetical protein [Amorphus orientalis]MDQ0317501.1 hypothetical protein [Amorphus orientalis]
MTLTVGREQTDGGFLPDAFRSCPSASVQLCPIGFAPITDIHAEISDTAIGHPKRAAKQKQ